MDVQQNFGSTFPSEGDVMDKQKQNSVPQSAVSENLSGCFECNICFDSCHDPVVTLCGHLYCWPCIYKWLQVQSPSPYKSDELPKCPVCKAHISSSSLVPLYGRGTSPPESEAKKPPQLDLAVPQRPPALGMNVLLATANPITSNLHQQNYANSFHQQQYFPHQFSDYPPTAPASGTTTTTSFYSPTINMVGEMVFSGMFGGSDTSLSANTYSNSYNPFRGNGSPRLRRQEMQLDKSLNRVSLFLYCFLVLCLLLF